MKDNRPYKIANIIKDILEKHDSLSIKEIKMYAKEEFRPNTYTVALARMVEAKHAYICDWQQEQEAHQMKWRPIFKLGSGKNAPRPASKTRKQLWAEYRQSKLKRVASVFDLGRSVRLAMGDKRAKEKLSQSEIR